MNNDLNIIIKHLTTTAAMAVATQFLSALGHLRAGGQLDDLDLAQSNLLASTLGAAAAANLPGLPDVATNLSNDLVKQQVNSTSSNTIDDNNNNNNTVANNHLHSTNSTIIHNNNNNNNQITPQSVAEQLFGAATAASSSLSSSTPSVAGPGNGSLGSPGSTVVHSIPHPHSHHALSHPAASLLINNPHYQTVRTKYSTRRYSRRRVGPEEAMADPAIRATVQLKMPVVPKTILIVLKHRLTVQTAITLACAHTGERLRKGAIQKKLEAMFREPGAVDSFLTEWDHPR